MRIFLRLRSLKDCAYDLKYFHKLQGFVYSLIRDSPYSLLHDKKGNKFFCFSNLFPVRSIVKNGDVRNLIISSPDSFFIKFLENKLQKLSDSNTLINIGEMHFQIEKVSLVKPKIKRSCRLISATPIIVRIPEEKYEIYEIPKELRKKRYVYWRKEFSFNAFIKQLNENLFKKYNEFYKQKIEEFQLFEQFVFKKEVCNHVVMDGREIKTIGSIWEFVFSYLDKEAKKILEFGIDCGFGERNSLGFGFINPK